MEESAVNETRRPLRDLSILVPVDTVSQAQEILPLALTLAGSAGKSSVNLIGVTPVAPESSLSEGAVLAQSLRKDLERLSDGDSRINRLAGSFVSHEPWEDIEALVEDRMEESDLLLLPWKADKRYLQADLSRLLSDPPCNVVVAQPAVQPEEIKRILLPVRGGPFANLSLQLALRLARASNAEITLLRVLSSNDDPMSQVLRERFTGLSDAFPEITTELQIVEDAGTAILRELRDHQAVILGASAASDGSFIGLVATLILQRKDVTALVVKTKEPFRLPLTPVRRSHLPVLVRVEKWFAENSFSYREFSDIARLVELKKKQGVRISLGLPTLNHESTIGNIIHSIKSSLIDRVPLLDEIVLIDSKSTDFTRKLAAELGVTPYIHQEILPGLGSIRGKGEALWKSLYLLKGDIIIWVDPDIVNPDPRFVYGVAGPLLTDSRIKYVKSFYRAPERAEADAPDSGQVTELLARPLINLFFPELSGIVQP
ncbi:MAG TPA: glycosyltransferase, partial [Blastocatellia bacterium]|nr:glycosyltransferase [Blastocatellia bacterium]